MPQAPNEAKEVEQDILTLKWGTLKAWNFHSERARELLNKYASLGMSMGAMTQHDTPEQKRILCQLIDEGNFKYVWNDWDGKKMTKDEAKKYVLES